MQEAWKTLLTFGLPSGAPRPAPVTIDFDAVRRALASLDLAALDSVERVVLLAWLAAWQQHWPSRFARELGDTGARLRATLAAEPLDENRYLKLRRIAIENLAGAL